MGGTQPRSSMRTGSSCTARYCGFERDELVRVSSANGRGTRGTRCVGASAGCSRAGSTTPAESVLEANLGDAEQSGFLEHLHGADVIYATHDGVSRWRRARLGAFGGASSERTRSARDVPRAIFGPQFRFADAYGPCRILQSSASAPLCVAVFSRTAGSEHGYDVVDHNALNPEIGTIDEHRAMIATAQAHGMGHVLDFVPNHMGILGMANPWWFDVLEWGQASPFANFFDIDWHPQRPIWMAKCSCLFSAIITDARGERRAPAAFRCVSGTCSSSRYYDHVFPLAPQTYVPYSRARLSSRKAAHRYSFASWNAALRPMARDARTRSTAAKERLAALVAREPRCGDRSRAESGGWRPQRQRKRRSRALTRACSTQQHYRLASWRVSLHEINYRRFFDINELAALRVEDAEVLGQTHRLIFDMIADGRLQGLRIDHVDGLFNPGAYCRLLRERCAAARSAVISAR